MGLISELKLISITGKRTKIMSEMLRSMFRCSGFSCLMPMARPSENDETVRHSLNVNVL